MTVAVTYDFQLLQSFEFSTGPAVRNVDLVGLANGGFAAVGQFSSVGSSIEIYNGALAQTGARSGLFQTPAIAQLSNGNLAIASEGNEGQGVLQILGQNAQPVGGDIFFTSVGAARDVDIAALTSGNFVAVAGYTDILDEVQIVYAYIFNGAGTELLRTQVSRDASSSCDFVVAALDDGGFVVAMESSYSNSSVILDFQIYNANGSPRGNIKQIDTSPTSGMGRMAITATDGGFAVVYEDDTASAANTDIAIRFFDANGNPLAGGGALTGPGTVDRTPAITRMPEGLLAVSLSYGNVSTADMETFAGLFNPANGTFLAQRVALMGNPITDNTIEPAIAGFGQGRVALFHRNATDNDVDGEALEVVRTSTGDGTGEFFDPSSYRDIQNGGGGSDFLDGGGNNDTLNGEAGGDNLFGGPGNDILNGGAGTDTAFYTGAAAVTVNLSITTAQNTGGAGVDTLTEIENLLGGNGADTFTGNTLANLFDGGSGADTVNYTEKTQAVVVFLNGSTDAAVTVGGAAEDTLRSMENVNGGSGGDTLVGDGQANTFNGNGGNDFLFGASFAAGGAFAPGSGADTLNGGDGDDGLWGGDGVDTMNGGANNDGMAGGAGNDVMNGGDGNDFLFGGDFSVVNGSRLPGSGDDTLNGGAGNDALYGFDGIDTINGDAGNDYVEAGEDNDVVNGGAESDTLLGQAGNDTITGGSGFDYLYGGAGADIFSFRKGDSYDTAWDFSAAQGDKLRLDPALGVTTFAQFQARLTGFTFEGVAYSRINFASLGSNDEITIGGIASTAWTAAMVEFA